ncbi:peptidase family C78-domain-containing protein [Crucibulum laeve]|uniref:Peptidase family C78-domain-containing protein n=1 Tax=Crucibulum laeve TaxID=68775 RepID=A0A5C3MNK5_9AGAR|nr:peptidase family C78-domain-containing protein [Crucibulum laeve]
MSNSVDCAVCGRNLDQYTVSQREYHCNQHFSDDIESMKRYSQTNNILSGSSTTNSSRTKGDPAVTSPKRGNKWSPKTILKGKERDFFWYPAQASPPPRCFTPGLIPLLKKALLGMHTRGNIRRAVLCYERAVHVSRDLWDASWGCGYRNFLMSCSVLMDQPFQPMYFPMLDHPISPSIRNLQVWIEAAWAAGFDMEGAEQLKRLAGTDKWIGTSDLWVAFSFRGVPTELVDFDLSKRDSKGIELLTDWIINYFTPKDSSCASTNLYDTIKASPVTITDRMPIILQHSGHSRTIIGYEVDKHGIVNLLTFDPGNPILQELRKAAINTFLSSSTTNTDGRTHDTQLNKSSASQQQTFSSNGNSKRRASDASELILKRPRPYLPDNDVLDLTGEDDFAGTSSKQQAQHIRGGAHQASDDDVVIVDRSSGNNKTRKTPEKRKNEDPQALLKRFRLDNKKLGKKNKYQILYFPMTAPLTEWERQARKNVTSTKLS